MNVFCKLIYKLLMTTEEMTYCTRMRRVNVKAMREFCPEVIYKRTVACSIPYESGLRDRLLHISWCTRGSS